MDDCGLRIGRIVVTETNLFPEMLLKRKITVIYDK